MKHVWKDKYWLTVSNLLTACRLLAGPVIVLCMYQSWWNRAFYIFVLAAATDLLDGHLARAFDQQTNLGALLDPMADKTLVLSTLSGLVFLHTPFLPVPLWFWLILFSREILMLAGAAYVVFSKQDISLNPTLLGKMTTLTQIGFLLWLYICFKCNWQPLKTLSIVMMLVLIVAVTSSVHYFFRAYKALFQNQNH